VVANAKALAEALMERGFELVSGGTDNHLILVDLTSKGIAGKPAAQALDRAGIELNYNTVPFDPRKPFEPVGRPARHPGDHHPRPRRRGDAADRGLDGPRGAGAGTRVTSRDRQGRRRGA
jgi:hypothetical protein